VYILCIPGCATARLFAFDCGLFTLTTIERVDDRFHTSGRTRTTAASLTDVFSFMSRSTTHVADRVPRAPALSRSGVRQL